MIEFYWGGTQFEIYVWCEGKECPVRDFLTTLRENDNHDADLLARHINIAAQRGPRFLNKQKCRHLGDGIYEFKARGGSRILWFYGAEEKSIIVCTHGFKKPTSNKGYGPEIAHAKSVREQYLAELKKASEKR
jgi:hypothetical protein